MSDIYSRFIELPWWRIYTTNYDTAIEAAFSKNGRQAVTLDLDHSSSKPIPNNSIIHLNGSILTVNASNFRQKIRLTASTYWDDRISASGWLNRLHRDIAQARCIVFVGYSLFDIDIAKLLYANPEFSKKTFFIDSPTSDPIKDGKLAPFGTVIHSGFELAATNILEESKSLPKIQETYYSCFSEIVAPQEIRAIDAPEARRFYATGANAEDIIFSPPAIRSTLVANRDFLGSFSQQLRQGATRYVLNSKIGNGKSVAILMISEKLISDGFRVFNFRRSSERLSVELETLKNIGKVAVIIENAFGNLEQLQMISEALGRSAVLITSARTSAIELRGSELPRVLGGEYRRYALDSLRGSERDALAVALDGLGFFGKFTSRGPLSNFIDEWGNDLRSVVIKLFEETDLLPKLKKQLSDASLADKSVPEIVITFFMLVLAEGRASLDVADELMNKSTYFVIKKHQDTFREFFDITDDGTIEARSSVLAEFCLKNIFGGDEIVDALIYIADQQRGNTYAAQDIWIILQQFMRFGFIEPIIGVKDKGILLRRYYDGLRTNSFYVRRPHFWLQYAIAMMSIGNYELASTYLETARSKANGIKGYNYTHLDNHTARYMLESRARSVTPYPDYFAVLLKSTGTIIGEFKSDGQGNYTARICRYLAEFCHRAYDHLNDAERLEANKRLTVIKRQLDSRRTAFDTGPIWDEAAAAVNQAIEIMDGQIVQMPIRGNSNDFTQFEGEAI